MISWKLFSLRGIEVRLHWSLLLVFFLIILWGYFSTGQFDFISVLMLVIVFGSVAFHELSHSLVARSMGISIERILLLPIGGMAMMKENVFSPKKEFKMAIAGPMFNFALCALLAMFIVFTEGQFFYSVDYILALESLTLSPVALLAFTVSVAFWMNLALGLFNLVPAIPMDGGRVFRSLLAMKMEYLKATRLATIISNFLMIGLFLLGLTYNWWWSLIALFILFASRAELEVTVSNRLLQKFPLTKLVRQEYLVVEEGDSLDQVIQDMIASRSIVAFSKKNHTINSVSLYDIQNIPKKEWKKINFHDISKEQHPVTEDHPASFALNKMNELNLEALPVIDVNHEIVGCVFRKDVSTVLQILKVSKL